MEALRLATREEMVEGYMQLFCLGRFDAEELIAIALGESTGDLQPESR
jgi:hypothetical protein